MADKPKEHGKHSTSASEAKECPKTLDQMCKDLTAWATEWENWGKTVVKEFDKCCGTGGPEILPPPPKPPFRP
jgi:hypothetical protein